MAGEWREVLNGAPCYWTGRYDQRNGNDNLHRVMRGHAESAVRIDMTVGVGMRGMHDTRQEYERDAENSQEGDPGLPLPTSWRDGMHVVFDYSVKAILPANVFPQIHPGLPDNTRNVP